MARLVMFCVASTLFVAMLNADELPAFIRRTPEAILGTINPRVVEECVVKRFADPYPSLSGRQNRREYRWRVRVPDGSKVNILWAHGALPDDELPKVGHELIPRNTPLPSNVGDIVIVVRASNDASKQFEISIFPEFPGKVMTIQSTAAVKADWLPYWKNDKPTLIHPDEKAESRLPVEGQQLLMKHFVQERGVNTGYAIWLDFDDDKGKAKP